MNDSRPEAPSAEQPGRARSFPPPLAALLSLIFPGLGQVAAGRAFRGFVVALPMLWVIAAGLGLALRGRVGAVATLVSPGVLDIILVGNAMLAVYHAWAVFDAHRLARPKRRVVSRQNERPGLLRTHGFVAAVMAVALLAHGTLEVVGFQARETILTVFHAASGNDQWAIPAPSFQPTATPGPSTTVGPTARPTATPPAAWAADGRLNVLLIGGDAGPGRWSLRTDTMEVLSVDVATGRTALFGIPRNLLNVPLAPESAGAFPNGRYPDLLNSLYVYAGEHPNDFPGGDARGFRAVSGAIQELVGVPLDGAIVVNLNGFVRLVDAMGGLWIDVASPVYDSHYPLEDGSGYVRLSIKAGCQHLDGHLALAYARSRHMDSDYGRMGRQQNVLVSMAHQIDPLALVPQVPELLAIARDDLWTTFQAADVPALAVLAANVDQKSIRQVLFVPPAIPELLTKATTAKIRTTVQTVFDDWTAATPSPSPSSTIAATPAPSSVCG